MKKRILSILTLIVATVSFTACQDDKKDFTIHDCVFSSFTAQDFDGNIIDETVFAGYQVTMINVWGTYCEPCKKEMPGLAELNAEYQSSGFQMIGIPIDGETKRQEAIAIIEKTQANYRHLRVSTNLKGFISDIRSVPYTIFVNEKGERIGNEYLGSKSKAAWKKVIDQMLEFVKE